jgi:hypothetical protein
MFSTEKLLWFAAGVILSGVVMRAVRSTGLLGALSGSSSQGSKDLGMARSMRGAAAVVEAGKVGVRGGFTRASEVANLAVVKV